MKKPNRTIKILGKRGGSPQEAKHSEVGEKVQKKDNDSEVPKKVQPKKTAKKVAKEKESKEEPDEEFTHEHQAT